MEIGLTGLPVKVRPPAPLDSESTSFSLMIPEHHPLHLVGHRRDTAHRAHPAPGHRRHLRHPRVPGTSSFTVTVTDSATPPATASQALTITTGGCTTTITGHHTGLLRLGSGITCITAATITGPVTISAGATVSVTNSTISGPFTSIRAATISICASTLNGPVTITGSTGEILIGDNGDDGAPACGASTITGPVTLTGNTSGIQLAGNTIHGPVTLTGNTSPAAPQVAANHIGGPLACTANTPPPTDNSHPNTVTGPSTGQCATLA